MNCVYCGRLIFGDHKPPYCSLRCLCLYNAERTRPEARLPYTD